MFSGFLMLNVIIKDFVVWAKSISDSVTWPIEYFIIFISTNSSFIFLNESAIACAIPNTSALIIIFIQSFLFSSVVLLVTIFSFCSFIMSSLFFTISFASFSFLTAINFSPLLDGILTPIIWTGSDGYADFLLTLQSSIIAFIFP